MNLEFEQLLREHDQQRIHLEQSKWIAESQIHWAGIKWEIIKAAILVGMAIFGGALVTLMILGWTLICGG